MPLKPFYDIYCIAFLHNAIDLVILIFTQICFVGLQCLNTADF